MYVETRWYDWERCEVSVTVLLYYQSNERCKTMEVRVSELESIIVELNEKFQLSTEQISCLQKSDLDIPSCFY